MTNIEKSHLEREYNTIFNHILEKYDNISIHENDYNDIIRIFNYVVSLKLPNFKYDLYYQRIMQLNVQKKIKNKLYRKKIR